MKNLDYEYIQAMWKQVQELVGEEIKPRIMVGGKAGVGKSSVLNAVTRKNAFEVGKVRPQTRENPEKIWNSTAGEIIIVDVPGFGEADAPTSAGEYAENQLHLAELKAHLFLLILKCDDRALQLEQEFMNRWTNNSLLQGLPVILVVNQIDKMNPVRDWQPEKLNLKSPTSDKEKNIRDYMDYVTSLPSFSPHMQFDRVIPISAGESYNDPYQYGIENLRNKIYEVLPDAAKTVFARTSELKKQEGERLINYYAGACAAAVAANLLPASDALVIAPFQLAMIVHLGRLHKINITSSAAAAILGTIGMSFAGRTIFQVFVSFIPFVKNLAGPPLAYALTYSMGKTVNSLFSRGQIDSQGNVTASSKEIETIKSDFQEVSAQAAATYSSSTRKN